jgi:hypothetical protein
MPAEIRTGFSIFCLANPKSQDFTRIFGGSNGNEGLGLLSICFDWQYISGGQYIYFSLLLTIYHLAWNEGVNPMAIPLRAQFSNLIGYILCMYALNRLLRLHTNVPSLGLFLLAYTISETPLENGLTVD